MRVHIRPGPMLGACGLFGMIVIIGLCGRGAPDGPSTAFGEPVPLATPFRDDTGRPATHDVPEAPTTLPATTAPTTPPTAVLSPTSATGVPTAPPATAPPAPSTAATAIAPAATTAPAPAATPAPPPDTIAVATADPPVPVSPAPAPPVSAPPPEPAPAEPAPEPSAPPAVSGAVALVNQERAAAGLPPLAENGALAHAARAHSIDQASRQTMTHTGSDGSNAGDRIARAGFGASAWAENVAAGYPDSDAVMQGWMSSPDHRANILSPDYTNVGVASAQAGDGTTYWTMVLAA